MPTFRLLVRGTSRLPTTIRGGGQGGGLPDPRKRRGQYLGATARRFAWPTIPNLDSEQILNFRWSPDGKSLCKLRGHTDSDVVLLQESNR